MSTNMDEVRQKVKLIDELTKANPKLSANEIANLYMETKAKNKPKVEAPAAPSQLVWIKF